MKKVNISAKLLISVILSVAKNLDRTAVNRFFATLGMTAIAIFWTYFTVSEALEQEIPNDKILITNH